MDNHVRWRLEIANGVSSGERKITGPPISIHTTYRAMFVELSDFRPHTMHNRTSTVDFLQTVQSIKAHRAIIAQHILLVQQTKNAPKKPPISLRSIRNAIERQQASTHILTCRNATQYLPCRLLSRSIDVERCTQSCELLVFGGTRSGSNRSCYCCCCCTGGCSHCA
jgi:hypothetical protein